MAEEESKRLEALSPLEMRPPPDARFAKVDHAEAPVPGGPDPAEEWASAPGASWAEVAAGVLGGLAGFAGLAAAAPQAAVMVVQTPALDGGTGDLVNRITEALDREVGPADVGEALAGAARVRLAIAVEIDGVPAEQAGEIAAAVHASVAKALAAVPAAEGAVAPVDRAPGDDAGGWTLVYDFAGGAAEMARVAGAVLKEFGAAAGGVVAGVQLVRWLRSARVRPKSAAAPAAGDPEVTLRIELRVGPAGGAAAKEAGAGDPLKQLKELGDGLTSAAALIDRARS